MVYSDNGIWKEKLNNNSFGIELIETLCEQLDGTFNRVSGLNGTQWEFKLNNND